MTKVSKRGLLVAMRGPLPTYDDDECDCSLGWEIAKGVAVTALGALIAPTLSMAGERLAARFFPDPDDEVDADEFLAAMQAAAKESAREALREELGDGDDDG